jgi:hypothetical protein
VALSSELRHAFILSVDKSIAPAANARKQIISRRAFTLILLSELRFLRRLGVLRDGCDIALQS